MFVDAYHQLQKTVGVPVRAIHVVRNPYDMISTEVLYWRSNFNRPHLIKLNATEEHKYSNIKSLAFHIDRTLALMKSAQTMIRDCNLTVLEIHNVDFVHNPRDTMQRVCDFLAPLLYSPCRNSCPLVILKLVAFIISLAIL